jgi:glycerol-3-phosphate acyltransferase PlsX
MIWIAVTPWEAIRRGHVGVPSRRRGIELGVALVGPAERLRRTGAERRRCPGVRIVDASAVVDMAERRRRPAAEAKPSIKIAADLVARGEAAKIFGVPGTRAPPSWPHGAFGMLRGIDRPALAATIPTRRHPAILLDVGASVGAGRSTSFSSR